MSSRRLPNYWQLRIRTHEWAERQLVSLLDLKLNTKVIRALWEAGVTTAQMLAEADPEQLARELRLRKVPQCNSEKAAEMIRFWQAEIRRLWGEREGGKSSPVGSCDQEGTPANRSGMHIREVRCPKCGNVGYILRGISEPTCPECGERI
jgi:hypothetical protein